MLLAFILLITHTFAEAECTWKGSWPICGEPTCGDDEYQAASSVSLQGGGIPQGWSDEGFGQPCVTGWKTKCCKNSFWTEMWSTYKIKCNNLRESTIDGQFCGVENGKYYVCGGYYAKYCDYSKNTCSGDASVVSQTWKYRKDDRPFDGTFKKLQQRCAQAPKEMHKSNGYCRMQRLRQNWNNAGGEANCIAQCKTKRERDYKQVCCSDAGERQDSNKFVRGPDACEYSPSRDSCSAFWGMVSASGNYRAGDGETYVCYTTSFKSAGETSVGGGQSQAMSIHADSHITVEDLAVYAFALVGLVAVVAGGVRYVNRKQSGDEVQFSEI